MSNLLEHMQAHGANYKSFSFLHSFPSSLFSSIIATSEAALVRIFDILVKGSTLA